MATVTLSEAALRLGKSERTIRRMIASGQLQGEQIQSGGRFLWMVAMDAATVPAGAASTPDTAAMLAAILQSQERILAELAALRGALLAELPAPAGQTEAPPPIERKRRWWSWLVWS